jgi:adhesin/invasin
MKLISRFLAFLTILLLLVACGGGGSSSTTTTDTGATITGASLTLSSSLPDGELLAKQGQITIYADMTDSDGLPVDDGTAVEFLASSGSITSKASTVGGRAIATYVATNMGGDVTITASNWIVEDLTDEGVAYGTGDLVDEYFITVAAGPAVQIITESITPDSLGLRGSGDNEVGTFVFSVTDGSGGPVQDGQLVNFTLDSPTGGAEFVSDSSATTVDGQVTISLISGTVAGVATLTASTESELGTITTEARITMGNSQPDQLHLGFAAARLNVPGLIEFGIENTITAYVADRYSNPVPAGTPVYFAGECGIVALTDADGVATNTTNRFGQATATAVTAAPTAPLCKYVFWTEGQEAYTDSNGNGNYDDGEPHQDIGEPYIDANDNETYDSDETYFDLDGNGNYTDVDGVWQGNTFVWTDANIRWSASVANPVVVDTTSFSLAKGDFQTFSFIVADVYGNPLPSGTTIKVTSDCVTLSGDTELTLPDAVNNSTIFSVTAVADDDSEIGICSIDFEVTGQDSDGNGSGSTTLNGVIVASAVSGDEADDENSVASLTGTGSGVSDKFTITESGNYLFDMTYSSTETYYYANFDLKTESGQIEDYLESVDAGNQEASDVYLEAGNYYISVQTIGGGDWAVDVSKF